MIILEGWMGDSTHLSLRTTLLELAVKFHPMSKVTCRQLFIVDCISGIKLIKPGIVHLNYFVKPVQEKWFLKSGALKLFDQTCGQLLHRFQRLLEAWRPWSSGGEETQSMLTTSKGVFI